MTDKKLRIQALSIHVALVWDDGEELIPGPDLAPVTVSLSQARAMLDGLPAEVVKLAEQIGAAKPSGRAAPSAPDEKLHGPGKCALLAEDGSADLDADASAPHAQVQCTPLDENGDVIKCDACDAPSGWDMIGYCDADA